MPHITLEYSANLFESRINSDLLQNLNSLLASLGPFNIEDIKSRAIRHEAYAVAEGSKNRAFVHLQLAVLPGRPPELMRTVTERLMEFLKQNFSRSFKELKCSFSIEVRELIKDSYSKASSGS